MGVNNISLLIPADLRSTCLADSMQLTSPLDRDFSICKTVQEDMAKNIIYSWREEGLPGGSVMGICLPVQGGDQI